MLLNHFGRPEPSAEVSRRLWTIHVGLTLRYVESLTEHWAVCMAWQPEDRRWHMVQEGHANPADAYDIIGYLPMLCGADEAPSYLEKMFREFPREDIQRMTDAMSSWNTGNVQQALESAIGEVLDRADPSSL